MEPADLDAPHLLFNGSIGDDLGKFGLELVDIARYFADNGDLTLAAHSVVSINRKVVAMCPLNLPPS